MSAIEQQLSTKPIPSEPQVIADALNREIVPVLRRVRQVVNGLEANALRPMFIADFGDGVAISYDIDHDLNTMDVMVQVYDLSNGITVTSQSRRLSASTVRVVVSSPAPVNGYRLMLRS